MISRRSFLAQTAALGASLAGGKSAWAAVAAADPKAMTIYMSPTCGCCAKWVDHVKAAGFTTVVHEDDDMETVKDSLGVPKDVRSCHTAQVGQVLDRRARAGGRHQVPAGEEAPGRWPRGAGHAGKLTGHGRAGAASRAL